MQAKQYIAYKEDNYDAGKTVSNLLNNDRVYLHDGEWKKHEMDKVCPLIRQWKSSELYLYWNHKSTILKELKHIEFPNLKQLLLFEDEISSIQGINRFYMPVLQELYLSNNFLVSIKEFRKTNLDKLIVVDLYNNKINCDGECLSRMKISPEIQCIYLDYGSNLQTIQSLNPLCKLQQKIVKQLQIVNCIRIKQEKVKESIKNKYPKIEIKEEQIYLQ